MSGQSQSRAMKIPCRCGEAVWLTFLWTERSGEGWIRTEAYHVGEKRNIATWMPGVDDMVGLMELVMHDEFCGLPWNDSVTGWLVGTSL